jgi:hypothetical protein
MRRNALAMVILSVALMQWLPGCESLRPNEGRFVATAWAAYAGRFRIAYGRWPTISELEEFSCMHGRADSFGLQLSSCDDIVNAPFRPRLIPRGANLEMRFVDAAQKPVCRVTVYEPSANADKAMFPMIVIKTHVFACPGGNHDPNSANVRKLPA